MKKILLAAAAVLSLSATPSRAGNDWVAPLIGGIIFGGVLNEMSHPHYYQPPGYYYQQYPRPMYYRRPICRNVFLGYDDWDQPVFQRVCEYR